jgi:hypothetical protein
VSWRGQRKHICLDKYTAFTPQHYRKEDTNYNQKEQVSDQVEWYHDVQPSGDHLIYLSEYVSRMEKKKSVYNISAGKNTARQT